MAKQDEPKNPQDVIEETDEQKAMSVELQKMAEEISREKPKQESIENPDLIEKKGYEPEMVDSFNGGLEALDVKISEMLKDKQNVLFSLCGKSGSGKSEMARQLERKLEDQGITATILKSDDFYISKDTTIENRLNIAKLHDAINQLRLGKSIEGHNVSQVIIVDGLQTIDDEVVGQTPDYRAYMEADFGQRIGRRLVRDQKNDFRDIKTSLDLFVEMAVSNPEIMRKFEDSPNLNNVDILIQNDYQEPGEPILYISNNALIFSIDGGEIVKRELSKQEIEAIKKFGIEEKKLK